MIALAAADAIGIADQYGSVEELWSAILAHTDVEYEPELRVAKHTHGLSHALQPRTIQASKRTVAGMPWPAGWSGAQVETLWSAMGV